ncbi:MAG: ORF6N domain-containing protein [Bacteroidetes bacterium]|nr:ORF6N domain-containing protein [Bacteroidota bacterium]
MNKLIRLPDELIISKIYLIRGMKVMIDRDLAELYGIQSRRLREQVKRNLKRFPENFMFQLTGTEVDFMVSQIATPSKMHLGGHLPYAFTEHGILMLANVLIGNWRSQNATSNLANL